MADAPGQTLCRFKKRAMYLLPLLVEADSAHFSTMTATFTAGDYVAAMKTIITGNSTSVSWPIRGTLIINPYLKQILRKEFIPLGEITQTLLEFAMLAYTKSEARQREE